MIKNQISGVTKYNRYPVIFKEVAEIIPNPNKILSFGCSTGEECNTLSELYYNDTKIIGLDIDKYIIYKNKNKNKNKNIEYCDDILNIKNEKFDLCFVMSVLCKWPESNKYTYEFNDFTSLVLIIDEYINIGGYLCIYNAKFLFEETHVFEKYKIIKTKCEDSGFVFKYMKNGTKINKYPFILFQKIKD